MTKNKLRETKRAIRQRILFLTGDDESWMNNPEIVEEVQRLSKRLNSNLINDKRPLPKLEPDKLTKEEYQHLLDLGYQVNDIKKALGLGTTTFQNWRKANGIENIIKRKENNKVEETKHMKFNLNTATLLISGNFGVKAEECLTISKSGLALSGPVVQRLNKPEWVQLYLDEQNKALFVLPCEATEEGARSCVSPKVNKKTGYRKSWNGHVLRKAAEVGGFNIETDVYHVKPEEVEGHPNALGFDLTKAVKVNG
ncbi:MULTISPECIES: hypothetical protein [Bacteria]|jgi:hypothetical protein|uniref:hypothetical protein n=1 Tax=Bacteria TaxID=2 RepID=UPI000450DE79|nr:MULTISPECIES: hypothetical protein [Bacteria]EKC6627531.1 hypothetical protein [Enterococcus faecalis]ETU52609.1 hypothetical protein P022_01571 [Enterococcus faecalis EnGen0422]MBD9867905.1 hypothetical protein [Enterococcus faecalis]MCO5541969.1 hypothetical protein [Enterococcus faecalis]MCU2205769.1 hypothetical protein [Enterococcus faecalis]